MIFYKIFYKLSVEFKIAFIAPISLIIIIIKSGSNKPSFVHQFFKINEKSIGLRP